MPSSKIWRWQRSKDTWISFDNAITAQAIKMMPQRPPDMKFTRYRTPKLFGVFGDPIAHSLSPLMHNTAFAHAGANALLLPFEVKDIGAAVSAVRHLNILGAAVTIPHKVRVMEFLDTLDAPAQAIGAVNTIVNRDGILTGYNSDGIGALQALSERETVAGKQVAIIGAGGAARAIGYCLGQAGARILVANRTVAAGERLAASLNASFLPLAEIARARCQIMINTTPLGMAPRRQETPVPAAVFKKGLTVMDIVYTPLKTRFLTEAAAAGCRTIDGLAMFVNQGAFQFEQWTGLRAPIPVMRRAVRNALASEGKS